MKLLVRLFILFIYVFNILYFLLASWWVWVFFGIEYEEVYDKSDELIYKLKQKYLKNGHS